jgi:hypothetical protein
VLGTRIYLSSASQTSEALRASQETSSRVASVQIITALGDRFAAG